MSRIKEQGSEKMKHKQWTKLLQSERIVFSDLDKTKYEQNSKSRL